MSHINIIVEKMPHAQHMPSYQTAGSAGADLYAAINNIIELSPMSRILVPTGLKIQLPDNYEAQIRPRSGLALKYGVTLPNTPATIDSDYRGELKVILVNLSDKAFFIEPEMRIAQMVIMPITKALFVNGHVDTNTQRNQSGFGSTGY